MKNFVLDTNVLLHDPQSLLAFEENTVVVSSVVLRELDSLKAQQRAVSADARSVIRQLDELIDEASPETLSGPGVERNDYGGRLVIPAVRGRSHGGDSPDQQIIDEAARIAGCLDSDADGASVGHQPRTEGVVLEAEQTVFVSRDINARLLSKACGIPSQDYFAAQVITAEDDLPSGISHLTPEIINETMEWMSPSCNDYCFSLAGLRHYGIEPVVNGVLHLEDGDHRYRVCDVDVDTGKIMASLAGERCGEIYGVTPNDLPQGCAMDALLDTEIPMVCLTGSAGSGKTLLALAAAMSQITDQREYRKLIISRAAKNLDEDIGFLPGNEEEKVTPWLGAIKDNLEVLIGDTDNLQSAIEQLERWIEYRSINYMRGRSIQGSLVLIDEAQNLTPHQMKTLVTRIGQDSKLLVLGDLTQIDNPFLSRYSSGLTYLIDRFTDSQTMAHFTLEGVPRSELAQEASRLL